ncbi:MAG: M23 family metallopeptidase [Patescibacteria group bacterium]
MRKSQCASLGILLALTVILTACGGVDEWLASPVDCRVSDSIAPGIKQVYGVFNPLGGELRHTGIDYACNVGTAVKAVADGDVVFAGWWPQGYGISVWLKHPSGLISMVGHGSEAKVKLGDRVVKGQIIMLSGKTGAGNGPHLHFGVANKLPSEFISYYQHADEQGDKRGWLDPEKYLGQTSKTPDSAVVILFLCVAVPLGGLLIIWLVASRQPEKMGEGFVWVASNREMLIHAAKMGLKDALGWWFFVTVGAVVLSQPLLSLVRLGFSRWITQEVVIENWRFTVLALALLINLLLRAISRAYEEKRQQEGGSSNQIKVVYMGILGVLIVAVGIYFFVDKNQQKKPDADYFPDFPTISYWNGSKMHFSVPNEVKLASIAAAKVYGCDSDLLLAVAFSETPSMNVNAASGSGARGIWQFMPGTWARYWPGANPPSPSDIASAASAACRMVLDLKLAEQTNEGSFVKRFVGLDGGQCWNCADRDGSENDPAVKQAHFVWRLWRTLQGNNFSK